MKLIFEDWEKCETITSKEDIKTFLSTLGKPGNIYAILEDGNAFIQAAGNQKRGFGIQYKLASGELYTAKKLDFTKDQVIDAFQNYYVGNDAWKKDIQWEFDPFEADPDQDRPEGKFAEALDAFMRFQPSPEVKSVKPSNKIFQVGLKILLTLVGIGLITIGLGGIKRAYDLSHYPQTEGVVQSFKVEPKTEDAPVRSPKNLGCPEHCYPRLNYTSLIQYEVGGIPYELVGSYSEDSQDKLHEKYTVVYNPHNPTKVEIYDFTTMYIFPILMLFCGLLVLYFAYSNTWQNIKDSPRFKGGIFLCIGTIVFLLSAYNTLQNYRIYDAQTTGVVKGFYYNWRHSSRGISSGWVYSPIVEYLVDGKVYQCSNTNSSLNPPYHIHEQIQVAYDPMNPAVSMISSELNDGMGILISIGLWCAYLGGMMVFGSLQRFMRSTKVLKLLQGAIVFSIFPICSLGFKDNTILDNIILYAAWLGWLFGIGYNYYIVTRKKRQKKKPESRKKFLR